MNGLDMLVLAVLALWLGLALWAMLRRKRRGGGCSGCCGNCGGCPHGERKTRV